ncbi:hypothetical protein BZL30_1358 [Mycobacterium kansasii]|uniref:Uncharacterized protein n=1 Tax=Mycobacterium kansasii TaxID=1768 RepID=A0A1V3XRU5_MYCKA|nr:hypothetical protein BZL30_1358 [Mycobacterium kansasii]
MLDNASISRVDDPAAEHMDRSVTTLDEILASAPDQTSTAGSTLLMTNFRHFLRRRVRESGSGDGGRYRRLQPDVPTPG